MPLYFYPLPILCLLGFFLGVICARWVLERNHLMERLKLEEEMTRKVRNRFEAYLRLEAKVMAIFRRLDEIEAETKQSLAVSTVRLRDLRQAMAAHEPMQREQPKRRDADGLGWMNEYLEEREVQETPAPAANALRAVPENTTEANETNENGEDVEAGAISEWEGKFERMRAEKHAEIERQSALIADLTERINHLQPKDDRTRRLEKEMLFWQDKHQRLERENAVEIATLRAAVEEGKLTTRSLVECEERLETLGAEHERFAAEKHAVISELEARVAELEPNVVELEHVRGEVREWQRRCEAEIARREAETADLRERIDELEPMESTIEFLWEDKAGLERTISTRDRELEEAAALRQQQVLELTATRESLADLENSHRELTERHANETRELGSRIRELEPLRQQLDASGEQIGSLEHALGVERERVAELQEELDNARTLAEQHEGSSQRWKVECEDTGRQLADWQERYRTLESDRQAEVRSLQEHIASLEPLVERVAKFEQLVVQLETAERSGRERITALEVEGRRLQRELESRTTKYERNAERLADVERSLTEATERLRQAEEHHANELNELQSRLRDYASELAEAQQAHTELAGKNSAQADAMSDLEQQLRDSRGRTHELEQRLSELDTNVQGQSKRITSLMAELDTASQESERVRREADRKRSLVEAAESVLAELRPKLQALEAQLHEKDANGEDEASQG